MLFRGSRRAVIAVMLLAGVSCKDELSEDPVQPDEQQAPAITITSPSFAEPLNGVVNIIASIQDESNIKRVSLFVDNALVKEEKSSEVNFAWDSHSVPDGQHDFRIEAEDEFGNKAETKATGEVFNALYNFKIGNNYVPPGFQRWLFISDETGQSSPAYQVLNNTDIKVPPPEGYSPGKTYSITIYSYSTLFESKPEYLHYFITYAEFRPGEYQLNDSDAAPPKVTLGSYTMRMTGFPIPYDRSSVYGRTAGYTTIIHNPTGLLTYSTSLNLSETPLWHTLAVGDDYRYIKIPDARPGFSRDVSYSEMVPMEHEVEVAFPSPIKARGRIMSVPDNEYDRQTLVFITPIPQNVISDKLKMHYYNDDEADGYITSLSHFNDTESFGYYAYGTTVPTQMKYWDGEINVTQQGTTVTTQLSKPASKASLFFGERIETPAEETVRSWYYVAPGELNYSILLPQIPSSLKDLFPAVSSLSPQFKQITIIDMGGTEGYQDYLKFKFQKKGARIYTELLFTPYSEVVQYTKIIDSGVGGGRKGNLINTHLDLRDENWEEMEGIPNW